MSPTEFWHLTYSEYYFIIKGFQKRLGEQYKDRIRQAWYTAYLGRVKDFPNLEELLREKKKQTNEQMMAMAKALNAAFGGEEIRTK